MTELRKKYYLEVLDIHTRKISRLESRQEDVDEHIINISSYKLSFFQKLALCRGLKFAIPKRVSSIDVKPSFEKAYWKLEPRLPEEFQDLAASTLRSVALNYIHRKCPKPPQTLLKAIHQLKRRDDIVVTKPDKGSGVVVMDKEEYLRLLADASINNVTKFRIVKPDRPKCRGRPPKHYHPLLQKEKELESLVRRILPTTIAESVRPSGSRLAHLYGLPKTHKKELAMRPILSATQTYNYALAKWLDDKLKPLVTNQYMISDTFEFVNEAHELVINNGDILVSYDVSSLFTNVPLEETIQLLADKAFINNWFNETYHLSKLDLVDLLRAATKDQLFTFNDQLYEQTDGVALGSPLGPLLANAFMCSIEETLERDGKMPTYYKRFVDDTLTIMPNKTSAGNSLDILNQCHSSIKFTMETESNGTLLFLGTQLLNKHTRVETKVYVKPTNTGLLLHYKSHVDDRYKRGLLKTMLDRAYRLSSNWHYFSEECDRLKLVFSRLKYPHNLVNSTISRFVAARASDQPVSSPVVSDRLDPIRVVLPFKDQASADIVRTQLKDLSQKIQTSVQPVFVSQKIERDLKLREAEPPIVNQQCLVYKFQCDLCDAGYVGFTRRHLHQRVEEHKNSSSSIGKHFRDKHFLAPKDLTKNFSVLMKCTNKFDCLVYEMFFIHELRPTLNVQSDSIRAKVFNKFLFSFLLVLFFYTFLLSVYTCNFHAKFFTLPMYIYIYILPFYFTSHLIMTKVRSKRRVLPLIFIVISIILL